MESVKEAVYARLRSSVNLCLKRKKGQRLVVLVVLDHLIFPDAEGADIIFLPHGGTPSISGNPLFPPLIFLVSFSFFFHADQACSRRCLLRPLPLEVARETLQACGASLVKRETERSEVARLRQTEFESLNAASCS